MLKYYVIPENKEENIYFMDYIANNNPDFEVYLKPENYRIITDILLQIQIDLDPEYSGEQHIINFAGHYYHTDDNRIHDILSFMALCDNTDFLNNCRNYLIEKYGDGIAENKLLNIIDQVKSENW